MYSACPVCTLRKTRHSDITNIIPSDVANSGDTSQPSKRPQKAILLTPKIIPSNVYKFRSYLTDNSLPPPPITNTNRLMKIIGNAQVYSVGKMQFHDVTVKCYIPIWKAYHFIGVQTMSRAFQIQVPDRAKNHVISSVVWCDTCTFISMYQRLFRAETRGSRFLRNVGAYQPNYTSTHATVLATVKTSNLVRLFYFYRQTSNTTYKYRVHLLSFPTARQLYSTYIRQHIPWQPPCSGES
jgi:hypothetical protein